MSDLSLFLLRYGEIGTKSSNIRKHFEDILIQNMERTFLNEGEELITEKKGMGRIFAHTDPKNSYLFSRTFGLVSYSEAESFTTDLDEMIKRARKFAENISGTFAVRARRVGEHEFGSQEVEAKVGEAVLEANPELTVDLDRPEEEFHIEIRHSDTYVFTDIQEAPGGLPVGSQGKVAAVVEDELDFLSAWLMMRRGARLYVISNKRDLIERLRRWDVSLKELEYAEDISSIDFPEHIKALVLGETLEDYSPIDIDMMVVRPLIGFTDERIENTLSFIERLEEK